MPTAAELIEDARNARSEQRLAEARRLYAEAATIHREQNNSLACAHAIRHIADMFLQESQLAEAQPLYEEALELYRSNLGTKLLDLANTVRPCALLYEKLGNLATSKELWQEARNLYASLRIEAGVKECDAHLQALNLGVDPSINS
jgi:tetratricopeptide (TPR) repeat protein